jgi:hypothetical protein
LLLGLHEVAHAASGSDTLDMVYKRSKVREAITWDQNNHVTQAQIYGDDLQAVVVFMPAMDEEVGHVWGGLYPLRLVPGLL